MTQFVFDQVPTDRLVQLQGADTVLFHGGSASSVSVAFDLTLGDIITVDVGFRGHTVQFDGGAVNVAANGGMVFDDGSRLLIGGAGGEALAGGAGSDALYGGAGDDTLAGHGGNNLIQGNQGNDSLSAEGGADTIYGGQGDDVIVSGLGMAGESGDVVNGNKGDDSIAGGGGNDILLGGQGNDSIQGGGGADLISGDNGNDTVSGGAGADGFVIGSNNGDDDRILDFNGSEGDRVHVQPGSALEFHQVGADTLVLINHGSSTVTLVGVQASTLDPAWFVTDGGGIDTGGETIVGSEVNDLLIGNRGADSIQGGGGADWMFGGLGDDTLVGGSGGDVFFAAARGGDDRVLDFNGAEGDRVRVEAGVAFDIEQDGMDTLILVDHGGSTIRLVGVQASTRHADWVVNV